MGEIVNPYIAGAPVTETKMFFGRDDVFDWIQNNLTGRYADHILVVHGQRRVGKTSVLKQLGNRLPDRYIPVFFDLQGRTHTSLDRFLWWLAREIVRVLKQDRDIDLPLPEKEDFSADLEYFENRFLPSLKDPLGGHILLLTFDEFDNLEESEVKEDLARPLIDYLRQLTNHNSLNFIFSIGSSGRKLENMQASYTEFFKTALYKKISFLSRDQTRRLVIQPVEGILEYEPAAVDKIYETAFGHPYFTQLICHELFSRCQQTGQRRLTREDVEAVMDDVIERGTVNLKFTWDEASDLEKWILASLAQMDKSDPHALAEYLKKQKVRFTNADLASAGLHLVEKDILTTDYRFVNQLLKRWLFKNRPIEQVREELTEVNPIANRYIEIGLEFKNSTVYDKAIDSFHEALAVDPDNIQAQVSIAQVYLDQKAYEKAVDEFEKALEIDDEDVVARSGLCEAHLAIGDASMKKGRTREAIQSYQRVLGINAEHTDARQRMADLSLQRAEKALKEGREEEALAAFADALRYTPEDPALVARVEAVKAEKKARELNQLLVRVEKEAGEKDWDAAIATLAEAQRLAPEEASLPERLASINETRRKDWLDSAFARANQAIQTEKWNDATAAVEEILVKEPDNPVARATLAEIDLKQRQAQLNTIKARAIKAEESGHWDEAQAAWREYLGLEPGNPDALASLDRLAERSRQEQMERLRARALTLAKSEKYAEGLAAWEEYLKVKPEESQTIQAEMERLKKLEGLAHTYSQAQAAFNQKDYDRATKLFKEIVLVDEDYKDASRRMAESVKLRRAASKGWQSRWLWGGLGLVALAAVGWLAYGPIKGWLAARPAPTPPATQATGLENNPTAGVTTLVPTASIPSSTPVTVGSLRWSLTASVTFAAPDDVTDLVVDGDITNDKIYASTMNTGIYKSLNGGTSWQPFNNGLDDLHIEGLALDPTNPSILYAVSVNGTVFKTTDGANSWHLIHRVQEYPWMPFQVEIAPWNNQILFESGNQYFYRSDDGGQTWQNLIEGNCPWVTAFTLDASHPETILAANYSKDGPNGSCPGGIYRSANGGSTWENIGLKGLYGLGQGGMVVGGLDGQTLYVNGADANWHWAAYRSQDGGATWKQVFDQGCYPFRVNPANRKQVYCVSTSQDIMVSDDEGSTWNPKHLSIPVTGNQIIGLAAQGRTILLGGQGVYKSSDGGSSWTKSLIGLGTGPLELKWNPLKPEPIYLQEGTCYFANNHPLYSSTDRKTWQLVTSKSCDLAFDADFLTLYRNDMISLNRGGNWMGIIQKGGFYGILGSPKTSGELYSVINNNGVQKSTDSGLTWTTFPGNFYVRYPRLFIDMSGKVIYANASYRYQSDGILAHACGNNIVTSLGDQVIAIDPRDNNHLFAATDYGITESKDGCLSWTALNGFDPIRVNAILIDPSNNDTLYAGTDSGAYISTDDGAHWDQINTGLADSTIVYSLSVSSSLGVYAATPDGIYKLETSK